MNKQIPSINKIVEFHNFKRSMEMHQNKVKNAKATLTTRSSNPLKVNINLNKTAKQPFGNSFSRMIDIQFQNKALLKKLTQKNCKLSSTPHNYPQQSWQQSSYMKHVTNNRKKYFEEHQRRLQNEGLLRRLKQAKPLYQMKKYMSQRKMTQKYINSISKFNYKDYKPNKTILKFDMDTLREQKQLSSSRQKQRAIEQKYNKQNIDKINNSRLKVVNVLKNREQKTKTQLKKSKIKLFTQRNKNINTAIDTKIDIQHNKTHKNKLTNQLIENNSSLWRTSQRSYSNSPTSKMENTSYVNSIPQKQIKINGRFYLIKGKQSMTKLKLQILELKRDKTIGNQYIHQVQISNSVYNKKFQGRIDVIIQSLKFDNKSQAFYLN